MVEIIVGVCGKNVKIMAAVLEINGFDLLLGNDALSQLKKVEIDYSQGGPARYFCVNNFNVAEQASVLRKVTCQYSMTIPARSVMLINVDV